MHNPTLLLSISIFFLTTTALPQAVTTAVCSLDSTIPLCDPTTDCTVGQWVFTQGTKPAPPVSQSCALQRTSADNIIGGGLNDAQSHQCSQLVPKSYASDTNQSPTLKINVIDIVQASLTYKELLTVLQWLKVQIEAMPDGVLFDCRAGKVRRVGSAFNVGDWSLIDTFS